MVQSPVFQSYEVTVHFMGSSKRLETCEAAPEGLSTFRLLPSIMTARMGSLSFSDVWIADAMNSANENDLVFANLHHFHSTKNQSPSPHIHRHQRHRVVAEYVHDFYSDDVASGLRVGVAGGRQF